MAAEFVGNLATECLSPFINYFFRFGRNVEELKNQLEKLKIKKEMLQNDVDMALRQTEVIYDNVILWLTRAEKELKETRSLEDEIERNKCFNWRPSWGWRYCLSKKVAKKTLCIRKLIDAGNFERLGQRPPLQGIEFLPSKNFKASESSTVAFNAIIKALTTDGVNRIGLYGRPGVGKTTLAKEVGKYVGEQELFDKVVMFTMSQTPNISKIQDIIAEILGLKFKAKTEEGKAEELWRRLKDEKKILIIIDDVWEEFKLETIGIPNDNENKNCKVLLTTRLQEVCNIMDCKESFELEILAKQLLDDEYFTASQSSNVTFNAIIKALTTANVNMIGLYGKLGVGKTTLARKVGKYAREQKLFDKVVMVTVSQILSIDNIQDRIAEMLGLEFKAKTAEGKAHELWRILKGEKTLIIIDDVREKVELEPIGISLGGENEGCKILLTARLQEVCDEMNCQQKYELRILQEDEAWALFKFYAGLESLQEVSLSTIKLIELAKELVRECQGLPIAITTLASSLKGQSLNAWEAAYKRLKDTSHSDYQSNEEIVYSSLRLSYDYLRGDNIKSCFFLCSLFPEDYDIPIDRLALIGIGQGLFCDVESIEEKRKCIHQALQDLERSGLLLEINEEKQTVRMHDVVRDFTHWLISNRDIKFMVKDLLTEWPMTENFESHIAIALWNVNVNSFPDKLKFKKLKTLILHGNGHHMLTTPTTFFKEMKALRVLWLQHVEFSVTVLQFLTNLEALVLVDCKLIDYISSLINMEKLKIFYVEGVSIDVLSEESERL